MKAHFERIIVIETTIDDMNPQAYDAVMQKLLNAGALDVTLTSVQAKKNRPAIILTCQSPPAKKDVLCDLILRETTTFGVRYYSVERKVLARKMRTIKTALGSIRVKQGFDEQGRLIKQIPEYEDVKRLAKKQGKSFFEMYQECVKWK